MSTPLAGTSFACTPLFSHIPGLYFHIDAFSSIIKDKEDMSMAMSGMLLFLLYAGLVSALIAVAIYIADRSAKKR